MPSVRSAAAPLLTAAQRVSRHADAANEHFYRLRDDIADWNTDVGPFTSFTHPPGVTAGRFALG